MESVRTLCLMRTQQNLAKKAGAYTRGGREKSSKVFYFFVYGAETQLKQPKTMT